MRILVFGKGPLKVIHRITFLEGKAFFDNEKIINQINDDHRFGKYKIYLKILVSPVKIYSNQ